MTPMFMRWARLFASLGLTLVLLLMALPLALAVLAAELLQSVVGSVDDRRRKLRRAF